MEHYRFTGDREFLQKRAYPIMKEAAKFILGFFDRSSRRKLPQRASWLPTHPIHPKTPSSGRTAVNRSLTTRRRWTFKSFTICFTNLLEANQVLGT